MTWLPHCSLVPPDSEAKRPRPPAEPAFAAHPATGEHRGSGSGRA